ncbi:MAG: glycosyltransferase family 2 protein [Candidatus Aureabacteria bacterium]|nr:glycosyltransferase family 2 protein [Candidatus Auribacterota bacterium]NLW93933.1 glycosyltransferase family 2 protein [Chlamydiota bacterium]HOE28103.1 glycosyltransferase family 2 protein [bacterium]HQM52217.1 glycosyltransferase family 2 protein [bacterium]
MTVAAWTVLVSASLLAYAYLVYPLLVLLLARLFPRPVRAGDAAPSATVIVPALNEERVIEEKIENTLALDYPPGKVQLLVVSDGSTDRTAELARRYAGRGVEVVEFPERRGKLAALLDALPRARGEILVFSDASGMLRPGALRAMAANFADPEVGGVCGWYRSPGLERSGGAGELLYWDYEFAIKRAQSRWATLLGATGAMYALRRSLFVAPPPDTINDDFVIPALMVARGHRMVLEEDAVVDDLDPRMGDFRSRVRVTAGNWQQLFYCRKLLSLRRPRVCWQFLSHKILRLASPFLLLALCLSALVRAPAAAAAVFLAAAALALIRGTGPGGKLSSAARKFLAGNAAALCGTAVYFTRGGRLSWK